jgi:DNA modification methylase
MIADQIGRRIHYGRRGTSPPPAAHPQRIRRPTPNGETRNILRAQTISRDRLSEQTGRGAGWTRGCMGKLKRGKVSDFTPDPANANSGTERGLRVLDDSLRNYGAGRSLLADKNGVLIAGNKTAERAVDVGLEDALIVQTDGKQVVIVQRTDLDINTPEGRALAYADNRVGELDLAWSPEQLLADMNAEMLPEGLFNEDELTAILGELLKEEPAGDPGAQLDRAEQLREVWQTERGQVWEIPSKTVKGKAHRLMCGDSTSREDVGRLLDGNKPRIMVTDPPYGVEYDADWRNDLFGQGDRAIGTVANDDEVDWTAAYELSPADVVYCWHAGQHASRVEAGLNSVGFETRAQIIWAKKHFVIGRGHYSPRHEPCWYMVRNGASAEWCGADNEQTLWEFGLDERAEGGHSTQKPTECMERPIRNHRGDVYEPFTGSGTTFVAAERQTRICYGMEIEPKYVAVTLQRLADLGLEPRLVTP